MRCKNCGTENKEGALYCGKCGQPLVNNSKKKKKGLAIALSIIGICVIVLGVVLFLLITKTNQRNNYNEKMSLGDKYFQQMKYEDAILAYSDAINIDRKQPEAYIALSQVYVENKNYEAAKEILQSAPVEEMKENQKQIIKENITIIEEQIIQINLDGDYKEQIDLGNENFQQKQYEEAILAYEAAIAIDDKKAEGYVALSEVYIAQQDYEKAYEVLESSPLDAMEEEEKTKITEQISKIQEAEEERLAAEAAKAEAERLAASEETLLNRVNSAVGMQASQYCYEDFVGDGTKGLIAIYEYKSKYWETEDGTDCCQVWYVSQNSDPNQLFKWENDWGYGFCSLNDYIEYVNSEGKMYVILNSFRNAARKHERIMIFCTDSNGNMIELPEISGRIKSSDGLLEITEIETEMKDGFLVDTEEVYNAEITGETVIRK